MEKALIRMRLSTHQAHYGGGLVDGAFIMQLFGDVATELLIRNDGDEGLFRAYESVDFLEPLYAGDYIEVTGWIIEKGNTSRKMEFEAHKVIESLPELHPSTAHALEEKVLVAKATGTCIVLKELQRN